jgi:hypothetical protein
MPSYFWKRALSSNRHRRAQSATNLPLEVTRRDDDRCSEQRQTDTDAECRADRAADGHIAKQCADQEPERYTPEQRGGQNDTAPARESVLSVRGSPFRSQCLLPES